MNNSIDSTVIHPSAIIEPGAKLGIGVRIGPFCTVGSEVILHDHVELISHVAITGKTEIGAKSKIFPFACIGHQPQSIKYHGEPSRLIIGINCIIRENATLHPGTEGGGLITQVGDDCFFMNGTHVAHDCHIGNNVTMAAFSALAGHCVTGDFVTIGGMAGVHQFVRIGSHAFVAAQSLVDADVIPYGTVIGNRARLSGLNIVGLKRRGFNRDEIHTLRAAYRMFSSNEGTMRERVEDASSLFSGSILVREIVDFINASERICLPRYGNGNR